MKCKFFGSQNLSADASGAPRAVRLGLARLMLEYQKSAVKPKPYRAR